MDVQLCSTASSVAELPFEYVERKGRGHPDTICDEVMEAAARELRREYLDRCGRVLHHNLDKALLVAGQTEPKLGGGHVVSPMKIIAGDRAARDVAGIAIPVDEIVEAAVLGWLDDHLRFVDPLRHVVFQSEIKPGSAELAGIFDRDVPVANDTSAAVGFAPLTETERIVLAAEQLINSERFKAQFPQAGEDVKVMGVRHGKQLRLTIAIAFVDRYLSSAADYFERKEAIRGELLRHLHAKLSQVEEVSVDINTLDDPERDLAGMYLTVLGTSAESGDGGEVGRGNAVHGLISLNRPTTNEAAAGKNTICHVGNIYNHLSHKIAADIVESIAPVREAYVWLCSQIGRPVDLPWSTSVNLALEPNITLHDVADDVDAIVARHLLDATTAPDSHVPAKG